MSIPAGVGTFVVSAEEAAKDVAERVDVVNFVLTGQAATLDYLPGVIPEVANFVLAGQDAIFNVTSTVASGTFTLTEQAANIGIATTITLNGLTSSVGSVTLVENINEYSAADFSESRVIYLRVQDNREVAYVAEESHTIYVLPDDNRNTVYITPESRTVTVRPTDNKTQVYIAA